MFGGIVFGGGGGTDAIGHSQRGLRTVTDETNMRRAEVVMSRYSPAEE